MISFSFSVSTADEARTAAEVCDFLAEQLTTPTKRTRRSKVTDVTNDKPNGVTMTIGELADGAVPRMPAPANGFAPTVEAVPNVSDPAALYAALAGTPAGTVDSQPVVHSATLVVVPVEPVVEPEVAAALVVVPAAVTREDRLNAAREAIKTRGGKWYSDYLVANKLDKKLSDFTEDELRAVLVAAS